MQRTKNKIWPAPFHTVELKDEAMESMRQHRAGGKEPNLLPSDMDRSESRKV